MDERVVIIFFWLAFMAYGAAFVFYINLFLHKRQWTSILATSLLLLGFVFHSVSLAARWLSVGRLPMEGAFESYFIFSWSLVLIYLSLEWLTKLKVLGACLLPFVGTLLGISWFRYESPERLSGIVKSSWIIMHVSVIFLAYAGFTIAAVTAILYLLQQRQLKKHSANILFRRLPSLEVLDDLSNKAVSFGLPFITMTIITGILRSIKQFPLWYLDPIVLSTAGTWFVYTFYLVLRYLANWPGRRVAYIAIIGFLSVFFIEVLRYFPFFHRFG